MICNTISLASNTTTPLAILGPVDATFTVYLLNFGSIWITTDPNASTGANGNAAQIPTNNEFTITLHENDTLYVMNGSSQTIGFIATPVS